MSGAFPDPAAVRAAGGTFRRPDRHRGPPPRLPAPHGAQSGGAAAGYRGRQGAPAMGRRSAGLEGPDPKLTDGTRGGPVLLEGSLPTGLRAARRGGWAGI